MSQSAQPVRVIADQKRVVTGGRTVLTFEVDDECLRLLEQVKDLHSHKGTQKLGELLKDILKEHLKAKHPSYKGVAKRDIRVQSEFEIDGAVANSRVASTSSDTNASSLSHESAAQQPERSRAIPAQV